MGKLALALAVLFLGSLAFSFASELPENDVSTGDLLSTMPESTSPVILLPTESENPAESKQPENELRTVESNEKVTTVTFRPADHGLDGKPGFRFLFRHGRPCRHGRRPFKPLDLPKRGPEVPYGDDMILANEKLDSDTDGTQDLPPWARFHHHRHHHHHGEPEFEEKGQTFRMMRHGDADQHLGRDRKRFRHGHLLFEREDDGWEEHDHHHHHRDHHHHHHHHHHHEEDEEEEEKAGFVMKFRKFLMDRF